MEEEKKQTPSAPRIPNNLKSAIGTVVTLLVLACIVLLILWPIYGFNNFYLVLAAVSFFTANCVNSIQVVQPPEIWIIERFGKFYRNLEPGVHWTIPWVETIRKKLPLYEKSLDALRSKDQIVLVDGSAELMNPRIFFEIDEKQAEKVVYSLENYEEWVEKVSGPIVRRYLNTLTTDEVLDEGAGRGNIIARMRERPGIMKKQIKQIDDLIKGISGKIKELQEKKKDTRLLEYTKQKLEDEKIGKEGRLASQNRVKTEFKDFEDQAYARGFKKIHRIVIGEFVFPDDIKKAREDIHRARKDAISAVSKAITEATMRTEPIVITKGRLEQIGFSQEEAREKAYLLEIIGTLVKGKSLFLTGASQGDLNALVAQATAIFSEVSQRRKEPEKETKK